MAPVTVQSKEEFDEAFPDADEIVVDGDFALQQYAQSRALGTVDHMFEEVGPTLSESRAGWIGVAEQSRTVMAVMAAPTPAARSSTRTIIISVAVIVTLILTGAMLWKILTGQSPGPNHGTYDMSSTAPASFEPSAFIWPIVALVGMSLIYMLARQALNRDSNVEISWKVTSKVEGRLVITKVKERVRRKPS